MRLHWRAAAGALGVALLPASAGAQSLGGASDFEFPVLRLALGLLLCAIIAIVAALLLKRFMHAGALPRLGKWSELIRPPQRRITVLETHRLSTHGDVCMLICGGREYLIVLSPAGATVIRDAAVVDTPP